MDAQEVEEEAHFDSIAFVIILLFVLGIIAPYLGVMEQCQEEFFLFRPYCVANESWSILTNLDVFSPKICKHIEITPDVRNQAVSIVDESANINVGQIIEIYVWVNENIRYVNDPSYEEYFATADETLKTKAGDCDDQAILITNMINSVGGIAKLVIAPDCNHAFSAVYVTQDKDYFSEVLQNIKEIYETDYAQTIENISFYVDENGYWIIADPAGGNYLGDILNECRDEELEPIC